MRILSATGGSACGGNQGREARHPNILIGIACPREDYDYDYDYDYEKSGRDI